VLKPYQEFKDIFAKESFNELLDQINGTMPYTSYQNPRQRFSPQPWSNSNNWTSSLTRTSKADCIHPSRSPMASPVFFIKKKDGGLCLVQDYQKLNAIH